ncbi:MAG TPA: glycosyltransferase, partial [Opitutales bacterium]|nr:glycosyltransferase [Opitutales bacterium]
HGLWQYEGIATLRAFKRQDAVLYVYSHGMLDPWFKQEHPIKHIKKLLYWWLFEYQLIAHADRILFTTEEELILARSTFWPYKAKEYVIGHGTLVDSPYITHVSDAFLTQFSFLKHKKILFSIGRIHPKKGLDLLIQAWEQLCKDPIEGSKFENWALVIAGPTDDMAYLESLKALSEDSLAPIYFLPHLDDTLKYSAYTAAEFLILPSHQENFGIVVAEALASGTPVLISNKVNLWREALEGGACWVNSDTLPGIRDLVLRAINTVVDDKLVKLAKNTAAQYFDMRKTAARLIELAYNDLNAKKSQA